MQANASRAEQVAAHRAAHSDLWARIAKPAAVPMVPVYEWLDADGRPTGCGTKLEFDHWTSEGVLNEGDRLGGVLCHEPASRDERRKVVWGMSMDELRAELA